MPRRSSLWLLVLFAAGCGGETDPDQALLETIPGLSVKKVDLDADFVKGFELTLTQPVDHQNPDGETFEQRAFLYHRSTEYPMVMQTNGYVLHRGFSEVTALLGGVNQLNIEHRFFGKSRPGNIESLADLEHLTLEQAADDTHRFVEALQPLYQYQWLSTGHSKAGETALVHRYYYPDDVQGTVAYVAPFSMEYGDPRYVEFLRNIGPEDCRQNVEELQKEMLTHRDEVRAEVSRIRGYDESEEGFEYGAVTYAWGFWQHAGVKECDDLPPADSATTEELAQEMTRFDERRVNSRDEEERYELALPYVYQNLTQAGYPKRRTEHLLPLLKHVDDDPRADLSDEARDLKHDPSVHGAVTDWLQTEGVTTNTILLYGEYDPWSGGAVALPHDDRNMTGTFYVSGGNHGSLLVDLKGGDLDTIQRWLGAFAGTTIRADQIRRVRRHFRE